jgi:ankyrin repeat protein
LGLSELCLVLVAEFGANILCAQPENNKHTAVHTAAAAGHTAVVEQLVDLGVAVDLKNGYRETPLWLALHGKHLDTARALVALGADVCAVGGPSNVPLVSSLCEAGRLESVQVCRIEFGAPLDQRDNNGCTPLHSASLYCKGAIVSFLLLHGADVNARSTEGESPLMKLARNAWNDADCLPVATVLVEGGADVCLATNKGVTALHVACKARKPRTALLLVQHGADIAALDAVCRVDCISFILFKLYTGG